MFSFDFGKHELLGKIVFILNGFATLNLKLVFFIFQHLQQLIYNNFGTRWQIIFKN